MSRSAQVLLALTVVSWTVAGTVDFGPESATARDVTILWVTGAVTLFLAIAVDIPLARRRVPFLRPAHAQTQAELGVVAHEGQRLLGKLNGYRAYEVDARARDYWRSQIQRWTDWADDIIWWRLPHMRDNFANEAGRNMADFMGAAWQRGLQTWMDVRMQRLNEMIVNAKELQEELGPKPSGDKRKAPQWGDPPEPTR